MFRRPRLPLLLAWATLLGLLPALGDPAPLHAAAPAALTAPLGSGEGSAGLGEALAPSNPSQIALAEHLRARGVVFYGAYWCQHCFDQKVLFGQQAGDRLPYLECARDEAGARRCEQAGMTAYPTWVLPDGQRLIGVQSLQQLATWSGYSGPTAFPASRLGR
ncbi:MAG: hypothetical protein ACKOXO_12510 [Cyanobium sp.]